jgi:alginate O-acetyltransferase complex protein AlgI
VGDCVANLAIVMLIGGLWHGANWTFVVWGGIHGILLGVNHAWNGLDISKARYFNTMVAKRAFVLLTFLVVTLAWIPFRSNTLHDAWRMWLAVFPIPENRTEVVDLVRDVAAVRRFWQTDVGLVLATVAAGTWLLPNSNQIFARFDPVINLSQEQLRGAWSIEVLDWKVATVLAVMFVACVLSLSRVSPFLYFQF